MKIILFLFLLPIANSLQPGPTYYIIPLLNHETVDDDIVSLTTVINEVAEGTRIVMERASMSYLLPNYKSLTLCSIGSSGSCKISHLPQKKMCLKKGTCFNILDNLLKILQNAPSTDIRRSELIFFISINCDDVKKSTYPDLKDLFDTRWDVLKKKINQLELHTYIYWDKLSYTGICKRPIDYGYKQFVYLSYASWDGDLFIRDAINRFGDEWNVTKSSGKPKPKGNEFDYKILFVIAGGVLALALIGTLLFLFKRMRRKNKITKFAATHQTSAKRYHIKENDKYEVDHEDFKFTYDIILGCGVSGKVYKGILNKHDPESKEFSKIDVAIKICHVFAKTEMKKDMLHEISVMKILCNHPNIISLVACVSDLINPIIATEYCNQGDLLHMLREHPRHYMSCKPCETTGTCLSLCDIYRIGAQIADGMAYIAENRFVHRDLAARNVLMTGNNVPKIGDFGLCMSYSTKPSPQDAIKLPIRSLSIESLKDYIFCQRTDVWAYGVLFFEILTGGEKPYSEIDNTKLLQYLEGGERLKLPEDAPKELCDLIYECWMADSSYRPSFKVIKRKMEGLLGHSQT